MNIVVLDRDGVINHRSKAVCASDWQPLDGSLSSIARLCQAGVKVLLAIDQPCDPAEGPTICTHHAIHQGMFEQLEEIGGHIDAIFFCPHTEGETCDCRSVEEGLLAQICSRLHVTPDQLTVIGDRVDFLKTADTMGCESVLVLTGDGHKGQHHSELPAKTKVFENLQNSVDYLLTNN